MLVAGIRSTYAIDLNLVIVDEQENPVAGAVIELNAPETMLPELSDSAGPAIIDQIDRRFVPMVLLIDAGQSVRFPNSDNVRHHVYSFSEIKQFSTPLYANEPIEPVLFDKPGIAVLGCNIHDSMVAYVYVSQSRYRGISNTDGVLLLQGLPSKPEQVSIWHPWLRTTDNRIDVDLRAAQPGQDLRVMLPVKAPEMQFGFRALVPDI